MNEHLSTCKNDLKVEEPLKNQIQKTSEHGKQF